MTKWVSNSKRTDVARWEDDTRTAGRAALTPGLFVAMICETLGIRYVP